MPRGEWIGLDKFRRELREFELKKDSVQSDYLDHIASISIKFLQRNTPRETGALANSWRVVDKGRDFIDVGSDRMDLVDTLTAGVTEIRPQRAKALRFLSPSGEVIFASHVRGFVANPFVQTTSALLNREIFSALADAFAKHTKLYKGTGRNIGRTNRFKRGRGSDVIKLGTKQNKRRGLGSTRSTVGLSRGTTLSARITRRRKVLSTNWTKSIKT